MRRRKSRHRFEPSAPSQSAKSPRDAEKRRSSARSAEQGFRRPQGRRGATGQVRQARRIRSQRRSRGFKSHHLHAKAQVSGHARVEAVGSRVGQSAKVRGLSRTNDIYVEGVGLRGPRAASRGRCQCGGVVGRGSQWCAVRGLLGQWSAKSHLAQDHARDRGRVDVA
jgi:hypothetical protein